MHRTTTGITRNRQWTAWLPAACSVLLLARATSGGAQLPAGFAETRVAEGLNPTTMTFAPDGRLFVCEKQGLLRVIEGETLRKEPFLDISSQVDAWNERGLMTVCFDPDFARNGWIYVYYTRNRKPDDKGHASSNNRVSRFTVKGDAADPRSEKVILELDNLSKTGWHNGGGLNFGKDGKLYISTGENANGPYAQDGTNLLGKLLRINKDGSIPADNPNYQKFRGNNRAIVALGLRNPFSIAVQRTTGLLYLSMVGANYEQIEAYDSATTPLAVNYGWPEIDGPPGKKPVPAGYRAPAYAYDHGRGDGVALCSGDFYNPAAPGAGAFPAEYTGRFFFADYKGWIKFIDPVKPETRYDFANGIDRPIDVETAPDGTLWYIARAGIPGGSDEANSASKNGSVWRVRWTGGGQVAKLAVIQQPAGATAGSPIGVVKVALQDSNGKTLSSANDTVTLSLDPNSAGGVLSGTTRVAAMEGVATFSTLAIGRPGRGYTLRANSGKLPAASSHAFDISDQLAAPTITPDGSFTGPVWVRISNAVTGATIRFTRDGITPDATSPIYQGPFEIKESCTIQAIAQRTGLKDSTVASARLTITGSTPYGMNVLPSAAGVNVPPTAEGLPPTLSGTGIFSDRNLTPKPGVLPYSLNSPAWTDGALTQHWVIPPEGGKIGFSPNSEYAWPGGTVFVQHFEIVTDQAKGTRRRLETRLLVLDATGKSGYGATYRWRADQNDADLLDAAGAEETLKITDASGKTREQTWSYPASGLCFMCHTPAAGFVLGPKTHQLNREHAYPNGRSDNQLRTWNYLGLFRDKLDESAIRNFPRSCTIDDASASLETRVRSYLDANCAQCHRPGGSGALWDARFETPSERQGILNGEVRNTFGVDGAKIVTAGNPSKSILHLRVAADSLPQKMPPLTRNVVDATAVGIIEQWIRSLPPEKDGASR